MSEELTRAKVEEAIRALSTPSGFSSSTAMNRMITACLNTDAALRAKVQVIGQIQSDFHNYLADRDGDFYEQIKELVGHVDAVTAEHAALRTRHAVLCTAIVKFLNDTNAIPPWESAGAIWAQRLHELHAAWFAAAQDTR